MCNAALLEKTLQKKRHWEDYWVDEGTSTQTRTMLLLPRPIDEATGIMKELIFTTKILEGESVYTHATHMIHSMPETVAHRIFRSSQKSDFLQIKVKINAQFLNNIIC